MYICKNPKELSKLSFFIQIPDSIIDNDHDKIVFKLITTMISIEE